MFVGVLCGWGPEGARRGGGPKGWGPGGVGSGGVGSGGVGPGGVGPGGVGARTQKRWGPKGWGPEGLGARRVGGPKGGGDEGWGAKISRFFFSPAGNFILSSLSGGSSRGILVVFEAPGRSKTTKIQREDPPEREERMKFPAGERKKKAKFWAVRRRGGPVEGRSRGGKIFKTPTKNFKDTHQKS